MRQTAQRPELLEPDHLELALLARSLPGQARLTPFLLESTLLERAPAL